MADSANSMFAPAVLLTEDELLALFDRGAGIDRLVERLIDILDANDGDADLEDGHDAEVDYEGEATLGAPEQHHNQTRWGTGRNDVDGELELSLGAREQHPSPPYYPVAMRRDLTGSQTDWSAGSHSVERDEGESEPGYDLGCGSEHDGAEPDVDGEPILAAPENHDEAPDQRRWAQGELSDLEGAVDDCPAYPTMEQSQANQAAAKEARRRAEAVQRRKQLPGAGKLDREPEYISDGAGRLIRVVGVAR